MCSSFIHNKILGNVGSTWVTCPTFLRTHGSDRLILTWSSLMSLLHRFCSTDPSWTHYVTSWCYHNLIRITIMRSIQISWTKMVQFRVNLISRSEFGPVRFWTIELDPQSPTKCNNPSETWWLEHLEPWKYVLVPLFTMPLLSPRLCYYDCVFSSILVQTLRLHLFLPLFLCEAQRFFLFFCFSF